IIQERVLAAKFAVDQLPPAQPLPQLNFGISHVISQLLLDMPPDNYEICLSLHFYPIPSPALPLKGREIGTALPLKGREIGAALPLKGREAATTASITHYKPHRAF
ncbi:MAG: hypothetical protein Q8O31_06115, partial [Rhodocyclaceae bacterium]|nr:hypothetical protein [Rhodocyclaceae bacterium]